MRAVTCSGWRRTAGRCSSGWGRGRARAWTGSPSTTRRTRPFALLEPWTRLAAPALTDGLREAMIEGCLREADGRSVAELERLRNGFPSVMRSRREPDPPENAPTGTPIR